MARYIQTAAQTQQSIDSLMGELTEEQRKNPIILESLVRIFNQGFRCNPRAASATIRLNAAQTAFKSLPLKLSMVKRPGKFKEYNALQVNTTVIDDHDDDA